VTFFKYLTNLNGLEENKLILYFFAICARASTENFPGGEGSNGNKDRKLAKNTEK